jgi:hypothetical protein
MNNIPRQTGNGQAQSFNQGSNALQNQRNLQISNQMLTQSQNIGQTLPMIQNSQSQNIGQTLPMIQNSALNFRSYHYYFAFVLELDYFVLA